jgi:hypothetical protein
LVAGCSDPAERPKGTPVPARALSSVVQGAGDTLHWADTTKRVDTTFFSRGRVVTTIKVMTDSTWFRVAPFSVTSGIPFGLFAVWDSVRIKPNAAIFNMGYGRESPDLILTRIQYARSRGLRMVTSMTGGARRNYTSLLPNQFTADPTDSVMQFDMRRWKAKMRTFNTPHIKAAVAQAVEEGILVGNSVMDEPFNDGGPGNEANSWGPTGTMNKARVDSMCAFVKDSIFPAAPGSPIFPQGVFQDWRLAKETAYSRCDFITTQYNHRKGLVAAYRDSALAVCRRGGHACSFALNVLDGGIQARRALGKRDYAPDDCPLTTTGGRGTYFPNCRMTAAQVREYALVLGSAGCFLTGFRYDSAFMANPENQQAFRDVMATLATRPVTKCSRS